MSKSVGCAEKKTVVAKIGKMGGCFIGGQYTLHVSVPLQRKEWGEGGRNCMFGLRTTFTGGGANENEHITNLDERRWE